MITSQTGTEQSQVLEDPWVNCEDTFVVKSHLQIQPLFTLAVVLIV